MGHVMGTNDWANRQDRDEWFTERAPDRFERTERTERTERIDWVASCRLALVVSLVAALAALLLATFVGETAVILTVIVAGTVASWFHLEQGRLSRPAPVRHHSRR